MSDRPSIDKEFRDLIPRLTAEERTQLEANIKAHGGARDPLVVWRGILIDGHNRFDICSAVGLPYTTCELSEKLETRDDAKLWILRNQLGRRNLPAMVRCEIQLAMEDIVAKKSVERMRAGVANPSLTLGQGNARGAEPAKGKTSAILAKAAGVSHGTLDKVKRIRDEAPVTLQRLAREGHVTINAAHETTKALAKLRPALREAVVAQMDRDLADVDAGKKKFVNDAKRIITEARHTERVEKLASISAGNVPLTADQKYPIIVADPPWRYEHAATENRAIENQYPTMELADICALKVSDLATPDAVLFMWTTSPKLEESLRVVAAWGFVYRTCAVWDKEKIGMGYFFRQQHELLLVAVRGAPPHPAPADRVSSVMRSPRGAHSVKPACSYEIIEAMYPTLPKVELFCRAPREGWAAWGNQS